MCDTRSPDMKKILQRELKKSKVYKTWGTMHKRATKTQEKWLEMLLSNKQVPRVLFYNIIPRKTDGTGDTLNPWQWRNQP